MYLYLQRDSLFHRLHPVTKIALLILMVTIPFFVPGLQGIAGAFAMYLALLLAARGGANLIRFWKMMVIFWVATFAIWIVIPYLRSEPWSLQQAALLATRIVSFVVAGLLFGTICRIEEFTYGLTKIGVPYKGAFALSLGFRLVPLFYQNLGTIVDAQKSRGVDPDSAGLIQKAKLYLPILSILISYGLRNADLMAMSLEAKGFGYSSRRTSFLQPVFGIMDFAALLLPVAVIVYLWRFS
jgi:energy-coupling factor transport system permease protein